jgi:hypothetical protein
LVAFDERRAAPIIGGRVREEFIHQKLSDFKNKYRLV